MALAPTTAILRFVVSLLLLVGCLGTRPLPCSPATTQAPAMAPAPTMTPAPTMAPAPTMTAVVDGITAIYNFGDSISDTGNFIREGAVGLVEHTGEPPYGSAIGAATGRCSDGYLMIDFLADDLGLPLLSPYLDERGDFTHGANFAVTGATALDTASLASMGVGNMPHTNSSLSVQLQWFKDHLSSTTNSPSEARDRLASSLVMLGEIGGNDYNYAYATNRPRHQAAAAGDDDWPHSLYYKFYNIGQMITGAVEAMALVPHVVAAITGAARELLEMGATRMVIPGNFPLGCAPSYLSAVGAEQKASPASAYDGNGCLIGLNLFAQMHNVALQHGIRELRASYPGATIAYADYFSAYVRMLRGAASGLGFDAAAATKACCGAAGGGEYNFDMDRMCGAPGTTVCERPDEYLSWDGVHLTQRAYQVMNELLYHRGFAYPAPIDFPRT